MSTASDPSSVTRRIILVDDEEVLAWALSNRLTRARPHWVVVTANTGEVALERIRSGASTAAPIDLLVADVRMPGMSGIDLILAARLEHPELPVVVMTAFQTPEIQRIVGAPFTGFLEKPFEFELLELVDEALAKQSTTVRSTGAGSVGFSGAISVQTLPDIVQLYVLSSTTGLLIVNHHTGEGRVWFERGAILHAVTPRNKGDDAFYEIMMWSGGEFSMRVGLTSPERSIESDWQGLLMESCRRIDEHRRLDEPFSSGNRGWRQSQAPPGAAPALDVDAYFDGFELDPPPVPSDSDLNSKSKSKSKSKSNSPSPMATTNKKPTQSQEALMNIKDSLAKLNQIDGFVGAALVDSESGMLLGSEGGGSLNLEVAAAGNTEVVRAKRKTMQNLALKDGIEDILISLSRAYHLIRPLRGRPTLFFYVALDRSRANLAMARIALADVEKDLQV